MRVFLWVCVLMYFLRGQDMIRLKWERLPQIKGVHLSELIPDLRPLPNMKSSIIKWGGRRDILETAVTSAGSQWHTETIHCLTSGFWWEVNEARDCCLLWTAVKHCQTHNVINLVNTKKSLGDIVPVIYVTAFISADFHLEMIALCDASDLLSYTSLRTRQVCAGTISRVSC